MGNFDWTHYIIILVGAAFGVISVLPYAFEINKDKLADAPSLLNQRNNQHTMTSSQPI